MSGEGASETVTGNKSGRMAPDMSANGRTTTPRVKANLCTSMATTMKVSGVMIGLSDLGFTRIRTEPTTGDTGKMTFNMGTA